MTAVRHSRLTAIAFIAALAACQTTADLGDKDTDMSNAVPAGRLVDKYAATPPTRSGTPSTETAMLAPQMTEGSGIMHVPHFEAYLNGVLARLAAKLPGSVPQSKVYLSASLAFNAESGANGGIFITLGTIRRIDSEDELAFILGHEQSHIYLDHQRDRGSVQSLTRNAYGLSQLGIQLSNSMPSSGAAQPDTLASRIASPSVKAYGANLLTSDVLFPSWSRGQEVQADLLSIDLLAAAGYSPDGAGPVFDKLAQADRDIAARIEEARKVTQAQASEAAGKAATGAMKNLLACQAAASATATPSSASLPTCLTAMLAPALDLMVDQAKDLERKLDNAHGLAEKRGSIVATYAGREYPSIVPMHVDAWKRALADRDTRAKLSGYETILQALEVLSGASGNGATPAGEVAKMVGKVPAALFKDDPLYALVRANLATSMGHDKEALALLERSLQSPDVALVNYRTLIEAYLHAEDYPRAVSTLDAASRRFNDPSSLYPVAIMLDKKTNHASDAAVVAARCTATGIDSLMKECQAAAK